MMGMCLTYSLLKPEDALLMSKSVQENQQEAVTPQKVIPSLPTSTISVPPQIEYQQQMPMENAVVPYQPQDENTNFDLLSLIADVQDEELLNEDLLLAATQYEQLIPNISEAVIPTTISTTTSTKTAFMKRSNNPTPFTNCTIGSIGTINIHIHKN